MRVARTALMILVATLLVVVVVGAGRPVAAGTDEPAPPVTANEFIPEHRDLSECLSSLPRPDCGSTARGGWRQGVVFGALVLGIALIGWRVVAAVRRRDAAIAGTTDATGEPAGATGGGGDATGEPDDAAGLTRRD